MSHLDARFATTTVTVWRSNDDEYGQESWYRVGSFNASFTMRTGEAVDNMGQRYTPTVSYFSSGEPVAQYGDIVAIGNHSSDNPISLGYRDRVRTIKRAGTGFFGWSDSIEIMVG